MIFCLANFLVATYILLVIVRETVDGGTVSSAAGRFSHES